MASTAKVTLTASITGQPEGGTDFVSITGYNSSSPGSAESVGVTTVVGSAAAITVASSARFLVVIPPTTNTAPLRLTGSTSETGLALSSQAFSLLSVSTLTTYRLYTTGGSTFSVRALAF